MQNSKNKPLNVDWLIYDEQLNRWVPNVPFPEDADLIIKFGPMPELEDFEITAEDGSKVIVKRAILPPNPKVYFWHVPTLSWKLHTRGPI